MLTAVSDARSNPHDQIAHAANVLKRSKRRRRVFEEIYRGKKKAKTAAEIAGLTGLSEVAVLQMGGQLASQQIVGQIKISGKTAYEKDRFYAANKAKILKLAASPEKLKKFPTKYAPRVSPGSVTVQLRGAKPRAIAVTIDDFDEFSKVRRRKFAQPAAPISEAAFKEGIKRILGETGKFQDWGGERNDLITSKVRIGGKRRVAAFAFKGPGTHGTLTPGKLGKNGDQIQRLFKSPAEVFVIQYNRQIDQSVIEQMKTCATVNSWQDGMPVRYCIIDADDTARILEAYSKQFLASRKPKKVKKSMRQRR